MTLGKLENEESMISPNCMMVRAFDGTKVAACGGIDLKVLI